MKKRYEYACDICEERVIVLESQDDVDFPQMANHAMNLGWQHALTNDGDILICPDCSEFTNPIYSASLLKENSKPKKKFTVRMGLASIISLLFVISFSLIALWVYDKSTAKAIAVNEVKPLDLASEDAIKIETNIEPEFALDINENKLDSFHLEADETADVDPDIISQIEQNPEDYANKIEAIVLDEENLANMDRNLSQIIQQLNASLDRADEPKIKQAEVTEAKIKTEPDKKAEAKSADFENLQIVKRNIKGSLNTTLIGAKLSEQQALALGYAFQDKIDLSKDLKPKDSVTLVFLGDSKKDKNKNLKAAKLTAKGKTYHALKADDGFKLLEKKSDPLLSLFDKKTPTKTKEKTLVIQKTEEATKTVKKDKTQAQEKVKTAESAKPQIHGKFAYFTGTISSTFGTAAEKVGLGFSHVKRLKHIFSYSVNFKHFAKGDKFSVIFDKNDHAKNEAKAKILAAEFIVRGKKHQRIRFKDKKGKVAYYMLNSKGPTKTLYKTVGGSSKGFLRYPLRFKRISSHFNLRRRHPISRRIRPHKGTDFAAPRGTPVKTTADGIIAYSGWQRGYGRVIKVKHHGGKYETVYAHLSRINKRTKKGRYVKRGQVIGYVGSTGASTGNHLHYEFRVRGRAVNPMRVKLPKAGRVIATKIANPKEVKRFKQRAGIMKSELEYCRKKNQVLASAKNK